MIYFPKKVSGFGEMGCPCWVHLEHCLLGHYWDLGKKDRSTGIFSLCTKRSCSANWCHNLTKLRRLSRIMLFVYVTCHIVLLVKFFPSLVTFYHVIWLMVLLFIGVIRDSGHAACFCNTHWVPKAWNMFRASATHYIMDQWTCFWFVYSIWIGWFQGQVIFSLSTSWQLKLI